CAGRFGGHACRRDIPEQAIQSRGAGAVAQTAGGAGSGPWLIQPCSRRAHGWRSQGLGDVKRSLALLGLSGLLPIIVLASGYAISALQAERESLRRRADVLSEFSAALLSRELIAQSRSIQMVAQSPAFDGALDHERFKLLATRLTQDEPGWKF